VLREVRAVAAEDRHRPLPRVPQHLVQRRLERDRDPDERRLERQRQQRRDRERAAPAVHLRDDDRYARRPPPEQRPLLGSALLHAARLEADR
jgi:hypothetical protein